MAAHLTSHIFEEFQPFTCQIRYLSSFVPQLDKSLKTMKIITENLLENDDKYKSIYIDNKKIYTRVVSKMGGTEFFHYLGFRQINNKLICGIINDKLINK